MASKLRVEIPAGVGRQKDTGYLGLDGVEDVAPIYVLKKVLFGCSEWDWWVGQGMVYTFHSFWTRAATSLDLER